MDVLAALKKEAQGDPQLASLVSEIRGLEVSQTMPMARVFFNDGAAIVTPWTDSDSANRQSVMLAVGRHVQRVLVATAEAQTATIQ